MVWGWQAGSVPYILWEPQADEGLLSSLGASTQSHLHLVSQEKKAWRRAREEFHRSGPKVTCPLSTPHSIVRTYRRIVRPDKRGKCGLSWAGRNSLPYLLKKVKLLLTLNFSTIRLVYLFNNLLNPFCSFPSRCLYQTILIASTLFHTKALRSKAQCHLFH